MDNSHTWTCHTCGNVGLADGSDGFFYCLRCGSQADDVIDTGVADEDFVDRGGDASGAIYLAIHHRQCSHAVKKNPPITSPVLNIVQNLNIYGERAVMMWYKSLRKSIPLACTVAITFLACHVAKEAVLPTDMMKWTLEGRLPYFSAFREIEKHMGRPTGACPISSMVMFRPSRAVSFQKLASLASIADSVGLDLPPVNFYSIALRYLQDLRLPVDKILPDALKIYEWSMPPSLWLSTNELRLPTRVCVMSILIVAIRMLYNINGFGEWEKSLSHNVAASVKSSSGIKGEINGGMDTNFSFHDDSEQSNKDPSTTPATRMGCCEASPPLSHII